jgi:cell division control protein 6
MTELVETDVGFAVEYNASPIYLRKEALSLEFQPPNILHREKEMTEQREILNDIFRHTRPQHTMCFGDYGTGKTVLNKHLLVQLSLDAQQRGIRIGSTYVKCGRNFDTELKIIRKLLHSVNSPYATTGLSSVEYVGALEKECEKVDYWIVILDEVDKLVEKRNWETKDSEADALFNLISRDMPKISVIMITNSWNTISQLQANLDSATADTFRWKLINYRDYDAHQLGDILRKRFEIALRPTVYDEELINYIAGISASKGKRARGLILLAQRAAEIAQIQHHTKITLEDVETAEKEMQAQGPLDVVIALPIPQREIVRLLFENHGKMSSTEFNKWYSDTLAPKLRLGNSRVTRFRTLQPLIDMGIVLQDLNGKGQGKGTIVKIQLDPETYNQHIADALNEIPSALE